MTVALVLVGPIILLILYVIMTYNGLISDKNHVEEGWSGIDVQLKKRHNLIPALVETVKGVTKHEDSVFTKIAEYRAKSLGAGPSQEKQKMETAITSSLKSIFALAESYPELKSNTNFQELQEQLGVIEDEISMSRRYYNGTVRDFNIKIESFPSNLVAKKFNFEKYEFFELELEAQRDMPEVNF